MPWENEDLTLACLRLRLRPGHCFLNVSLGLVLGLDLFPQPLQIGLEAPKLPQEGGTVPSLGVREAASILELSIRDHNCTVRAYRSAVSSGIISTS